MALRALVCGGRYYWDAERVATVLSAMGVDHVIVGGASGADTLAARWARRNGVTVVAFAADWSAYGKAAGPLRNARMLSEGRPDVVVAFPGGRGTADMVARAKRAGVRVVHVEE